MVLELAVPIALARDYGQWENSPPHVRRWFQGLRATGQPQSLVLRRGRRVRSRYLRGRRRPLRCDHHRRQGRDTERDENPGAQPQDEMGRGKPDRARHHLHRCPGTGLLLRRPWRCVTTFAPADLGSAGIAATDCLAQRCCEPDRVPRRSSADAAGQPESIAVSVRALAALMRTVRQPTRRYRGESRSVDRARGLELTARKPMSLVGRVLKGIAP